MICTFYDTSKHKNKQKTNKLKRSDLNSMIQQVSFKGVFTIDEHLRVAVELTELDKLKKVYTCEVSRNAKQLIHIDLKEVK